MASVVFRLTIGLVLAAAAVAMATRLVLTVRTQEMTKLAPERIQEKAHLAHHGSPQAVREFVGEIFNQSILPKAAESIRERIAHAEVLFRNGAALTVDERDVVKAINDQVSELNGPAFARTNLSQLRSIRGVRRRLIPGFVEPPSSDQSKPSPRMGPAEAAYLALTLAMNKVANPDYQVTPEEWDRNAPARRAAALQHRRIQVRGSFMAPEAIRLRETVESEIGDESSTIVQMAHRFLDVLGLPR